MKAAWRLAAPRTPPVLAAVVVLAAAAAAAPAPPDLLLVDMPGLSLEAGAALAARAPGAVVFETAVAQGGEPASGEASLLTAQYVQTHGVLRAGVSLSTASTTLAAALESAGWEVASVSTGPPRAAFAEAAELLAARGPRPLALLVRADGAGPDAVDAFLAFRPSWNARSRSGALAAVTAACGPSGGPELGGRALHVPLLLWKPGLAPTRVKAVVRTIDVAPTLLEWAGVEAPASFQGASLAPLAERKPAAPRWAFSAGGGARAVLYSAWGGGWRLAYDVSTGESRLYDLARDPGETRDASRERPDAAREARERLMRHIRETPVGSAGRGDAPPELLKRLRDKGYW